MAKPTRMRSQPMATVPSGVTVGTSAGLTVGGGWLTLPTVGVVTTTGVLWGAIVACAGATLAPAPTKRITSSSTPIRTSVVENSSGFSVMAGVTRSEEH